MNTETEDQAIVNKGFLDSMFLDGAVDQDEDSDQAKYAFLASNDQLNVEGIDFSDPAALLRR